jgi:hypothetical protein
MHAQEVQTTLTNPETNIQEVLDKIEENIIQLVVKQPLMEDNVMQTTGEQYYAIIQKFDGDTIVYGAKHKLFTNLVDANKEYLIISKIWDKEVNDELTKTGLNKAWMTSKPVLVKLDLTFI